MEPGLYETITDTNRLDWIERGGSIRQDNLAAIFGDAYHVPGWWTTGKEANKRRTRYWTAREAIDAAIVEERG